MFSYRFLQGAAIALCCYGVLALAITAVVLFVGYGTFNQVDGIQAALETNRVALVRSLRTVSATVKDTATSTNDFQTSIEGARTSADTASKLANDTAGTFREMATSLNITIFGLQPLAGIAPQFNNSASQLQQLAISLGTTRDALGQNRADVQRVGTDLTQLNAQLDSIATSLDRPGVLGLGTQALAPFQVAFYGICLLALLQALFSIVGGVVLFRLQRLLHSESRLATVRTATSTAVHGGAHDLARLS